jgi:hypothetical protein
LAAREGNRSKKREETDVHSQDWQHEKGIGTRKGKREEKGGK